MTHNPCMPHRLKYERDHGTFFGREHELEWIHRTFFDCRIISLYGLGGIGKTRITVKYIYAYEHDYNTIFWANVDTNETLISSFVGMAQQMVDCDSQFSSDHTELSGPGFTSTAHQGNLIDHQGSIFTSANMSAHVIDRVMLWLSDDGFGKWLLVLDNADDLVNVNLPQFFPTASSGRILITSRNPNTHHFGIGHETQLLTEDAAVQLLLQKSRKDIGGGSYALHTLQTSFIDVM